MTPLEFTTRLFLSSLMLQLMLTMFTLLVEYESGSRTDTLVRRLYVASAGISCATALALLWLVG